MRILELASCLLSNRPTSPFIALCSAMALFYTSFGLYLKSYPSVGIRFRLLTSHRIFACSSYRHLCGRSLRYKLRSLHSAWACLIVIRTLEGGSFVFSWGNLMDTFLYTLYASSLIFFVP